MSKIILHILIVSFFLVSCVEKPNKTEIFLDQYDKIKLISYNKHRDVYSTNNKIKVVNNTIKIPNIQYIDNLVLDKKNSKKIFNILLSEQKECSRADCYNPRHILLFYQKNIIVGFYEFCAECGGSEQSKNINIPPICSEQGNELIKVFKEMNLKNNGEENGNYEYF